MTEPRPSAIHHPAESELFDETLSCELALPAEFRLGSAVIRPGSAEMLLRSVALVEDSRGEDHDERGESSAQLQRLEAKLDLTMVLLGRLVRQSAQDLDLRPLRWSRRGIRLEQGLRTGAATGSLGLIRLQPCEWLPDHIDLPVAVLAEAATGAGAHFLWLRFEPMSDALEMALERHLFRLHRRQIAQARLAERRPADN
ncbi:PilZ domain-containing protein [Stenotrophomonas rhizophila]|uniref:PilZ domain-containing protein n=1 Tax=Stenotrophomonas rhizophila TaxID=216778 RepID=UPI001E30FDA6|nr:PilZ domain-containing protein [Stenotrophomonas rhizophila]MCC7635293.1 PilZ domain-containing protein [Stenotrophomonas rhizophila]MCC7663168.1 PilZ domain-containing protein [Stenotrophomonas rhizophila]